MNESPSCQHSHTRQIAKDRDAEYVECLDCGALFEVRELEKPAAAEPAGFDESLSDA